MAKKVTSVTLFNDAVGLRMSATYSEIEGGVVVSDNKRLDVVIDEDDTEAMDATEVLFDKAKDFLTGV